MLTNLADIDMGDISPDWKGSTARERQILARISALEGSPRAVQHFDRNSNDLSDYWYWYTLSTLWVVYSGFTPLATWRRLFRSPRPNRATSLMKPSELRMLERLPSEIVVFRAHRDGEDDWIACTLDPSTAARFARERGKSEVAAYGIRKAEVFALFARRREAELIVLDHKSARPRGTMAVQA